MWAQNEHDYADSFDKPSMTILDLGPSPYLLPSSQMRKTLTCYVYPSFMVKQYDEGRRARNGFRSSDSSRAIALHVRCPISAVRRLIQWPEWSGYFRGAKGPFAFASDGIDAGMPFVVYDTRTGKKVFKDSYYLWSATSVPASSKVFNVTLDDKQRLVLKYQRVVSTNCDLMKDGAACWKRARASMAFWQPSNLSATAMNRSTTGNGGPQSATLSRSLFPRKTLSKP
jgi:hypothetical protein